MTGLPAGVAVEIQLTGSVWTDISDWVESYSIRVGRTSPFSPPQVGTVTLVLDNSDGRFTPAAAMLADGVTVNPYWPNLLPLRLVRVRWGVKVRGVGRIRAVAPTARNGGPGTVTVTAYDLLKVLDSAPTMAGGIETQVRGLGPVSYWPGSDPSGSSTVADVIGDSDGQSIGEIGLQFGAAGVTADDGAALGFAPTGRDTGAEVRLPRQPVFGSSGFSFSFWMDFGAASSWLISDLVEHLATIFVGDVTAGLEYLYVDVNLVDGITLQSSQDPSYSLAAAFTGSSWALIVVTVSAANKVHLYCHDGTNLTSDTSGTAVTMPVSHRVGVDLGDWFPAFGSYAGAGAFTGSIAHAAMWDRVLTSAEVTQLAFAGTGYIGETVDERIARFATYAGVDPTLLDLDSSDVPLGTYPQTGKTPLQGAQDTVATESGGAVLYDLAGLLTFRSRAYRAAQTTPVLTVDAEADGIADGYAPSLDQDALTNVQTVTRENAGGTVASYTARDAPSIAAFGSQAGSDIASYSNDPAERRNVATWVVTAGRTPAVRLPQVSVDVFTAQNDMSAVADAEIGRRLRVTSLIPALAARSQLDGFVEGWSEDGALDSLTVAFDVSMADMPALAVWDDITFGRWQIEQDSTSVAPDAAPRSVATLAASVAAADTSISVQGAGLSTDSADYPLDLRLEAEVVTVTAAPAAGATQTMTVTRGQAGTAAAPHATGVGLFVWVDVEPVACWAL